VKQALGDGGAVGLRRGFTLLELLITVMLMAVFGVLAMPFMSRVIRNIHGAQTQATTQAQLDNTVNVLRADVWQATEVQVISAHELLLSGADHREIRWQFGTDLHLWQTAGSSPPRDWGRLPDVKFNQQGDQVRVNIAGAQHFGGGDFCMVNPVMLTAGEKR